MFPHVALIVFHTEVNVRWDSRRHSENFKDCDQHQATSNKQTFVIQQNKQTAGGWKGQTWYWHSSSSLLDFSWTQYSSTQVAESTSISGAGHAHFLTPLPHFPCWPRPLIRNTCRIFKCFHVKELFIQINELLTLKSVLCFKWTFWD